MPAPLRTKSLSAIVQWGALVIVAVLLAGGQPPVIVDAAPPLASTLHTGHSFSHFLYLPLIGGSGTPQGGEVHTGIATYYGADGTGNCSFSKSSDLMVAAINRVEYAGSQMCGAYVEVVGPKATIVVQIVDSCPECAAGHLDLSREAFARIADPVLGRVPISWRVVSPALIGPIRYRFKEGSNQWWTAVQIRNHRNPIAKLEYRGADGNFYPVPRESYNYFVLSSGMGPGPYTFRVTDSYGHTLLDSNIRHVEAGEVAGAAQFPPP